MDGHRLTRRQALRLGAGAAAVGALRLPAPAFAASGPELFELALGDATARAASATWRTTKVLRAPRRFDLLGLVHRPSATFQAQVRARTAGGRWTRWTPLPHSHGGERDRTDPVFTGTADELQLRLRGAAAGLRVRFVRALPARPGAPRPSVRPPDRGARDRPARGLGRRRRAAAQSRRLRDRAGRVRAPHGHGGRLRARRRARDRARDRALPPRLQRLERHRLQLPRRPLRRRSTRAAPAASRPP